MIDEPKQPTHDAVDGARESGPGAGIGPPESAPDAAERTINPLAALTLVLLFPSQTFRRIALRPHWVVPLLFVVLSVLIRRILTVETGVMDEVLRTQAVLSGADIEGLRSAAVMFSVVTALVSVPVVTVIQTLFLMLSARAFGGGARFATAFSAVAYASVPVGVGALVLSALLPLTHSATLGANLAAFLPPDASPFVVSLAMELDLFYVWFFVLVGIAAGPVFGLTKKRARLAATVFATFFVLVMSWIGSGAPSEGANPLEGWRTVDTEEASVHFPGETPQNVVDDAVLAVDSAVVRTRSVVGGGFGRIECYVYPSLGEKTRVTGNAATAHGVAWADAVHVAWEGSADVMLTREVAKVGGARVLGKMYNPFLEDGLAVYVGRYIAGKPVAEVAAELHIEGSLPNLGDVVEPTGYSEVERAVGEAAAGSFTAFLMEDLGRESYREFYSYVSRTGAPLKGALERALSDSLGAIEQRWTSYIMDRATATGDPPPAD